MQMLFGHFFWWETIFDWCVVKCKSKNKHHKKNMFTRYWTTPPIFIDYSTINSAYNLGGPMYFVTITKLGKVQSWTWLCWHFIIDLLVRHKFEGTHVIKRKKMSLRNYVGICRHQGSKQHLVIWFEATYPS
jgi:hypothetical protein